MVPIRAFGETVVLTCIRPRSIEAWTSQTWKHQASCVHRLTVECVGRGPVGREETRITVEPTLVQLALWL